MELRLMERGRQQVLFNYLPDATFDYEGGQLICRVTEIEGTPVTLRNEDALRRTIHRYVFGTAANPRWDRDHVIGFPDILKERESVRFIAPSAVRFDIFPNTWQCRNPLCRRVWVYNDMEELAAKNPQRQCGHCGGRLAQLYQVFIHSCGHIEQARPPYGCSRHPRSPLVLDDRRSQQARNFAWICPECGRQVANFVMKCPVCARPDAWMSPLPHRANAAYYAHFVRLIDIPPAQQIVSELGPDRLIEFLLTGTLPPSRSNLAAAEPIRQRLADPTLPPEIRSYLESMLRDLTGSSSTWAPSVTGPLKEDALHAAAEYVGVKLDLKIHSIEERERVLSRSSPELGERLRTIPGVLPRIGLSEVLLVEDFPVVTAVFGYTRDSFEPNPGNGKLPTTFRAFPPGMHGTHRTILVDAGEAEGILFRLDPRRVVSWLQTRGLADLPPNIPDSDVRVWLLENVAPVGQLVPPDLDPVTRAVFGLVHSMAHIFARVAAILAGFERGGIAEYLFPAIPAFALFSNRTDFSIGGIWTLFETHLPELFARAIDLETRTCVYDPVCLEHGGACHACMHLPETSCAHLNRCLSRQFLFGEPGRPGYWEGAFHL